MSTVPGFPELFCPTAQRTGFFKFHGFLQNEGRSSEVSVSAPQYPSSSGAVMTSPCAALANRLHRHQQQLNKAAEASSSLSAYLKKAQEILCTSEALTSSPSDGVPGWWMSLLHDLEEVGWANIASVSEDMQHVTVQTTSCGHVHLLHVAVTSGYPRQRPSYKALLPVQLAVTAATLQDCVQQWMAQVTELQEFWQVMAELDDTAMILDPAAPQLHHTHRRILLGNQVSMHLVISPLSPRSPPQYQMIGSSRLTAPLLTRLTERYHEWDPERSIVGNLEQLLEVAVVRRASVADTSTDDVTDAECVVCYSLHYGAELPDVVCDQCQQAMHLTCLYTWLSGLSNSRQSMQFICGDCPYCTKPISCKVPA